MIGIAISAQLQLHRRETTFRLHPHTYQHSRCVRWSSCESSRYLIQARTFFDSVSDRLTDALLFGGLTWHYADARQIAHDASCAVMASAQIISCQRGNRTFRLEAKMGVMGALKIVVLALGLLLSVIIGMMLYLLFFGSCLRLR